MTQEAAPGGTVTYTFTAASSPGTRSYYSGTQGDLQVEMGLYGAIIVLPANVPATCTSGLPAANLLVGSALGRNRFPAGDIPAYDHHAKTCYDREYLFQFSEMDPNIHSQAERRSRQRALHGWALGCSLEVPTEPYHPAYFLINGRSMPDDMDPNYALEYPHQPYNGNPHMHPGEQVLLRIVGQGRWQHPFHEHANHVRILGRDGNLILASAIRCDASALLPDRSVYHHDDSGLAMDGIFYYTGRGLNWDMYGHNPARLTTPTPRFRVLRMPTAITPVTTLGRLTIPSANAINYYEWCQDHNKPLQVAPFGDVGQAVLPLCPIRTS